jgi:hypothetical protein
MTAERKAAEDAWRAKALETPIPPGETAPAGSIPNRLTETYKGFDRQYAPFKKIEVPVEDVTGLPAKALTHGAQVPDSVRTGAASEIKDALSVLPKDAETMTVGDLLKAREGIRASKQAARTAQDFDRMRVLGHAESTVTDSIAKQLSPEQLAELRAVDSRYRDFSTLEAAAFRNKTTGEFTPYQLEAELARKEGKRAFTQGSGGGLRELADQGGQVFKQSVPKTGFAPITFGFIPKPLVGVAARTMNLPGVRSLMTGPVAAPTAGEGVDPAMAALIEYLRSHKE